jgi:cytochrome b
MNQSNNLLDQFGDFLGRNHLSEAPTGALMVVAIVVLVIAFKGKNLLTKIALGLVALALTATAVWWHYHLR